MPPAKIAPSMLASDFANLAAEAQRVVKGGADWLHLDVMDGHFVPNITMGPPVIECLRKHTDAFFDCHMMVSDPGRWLDDFAKAGAQMYCFHVEAASDPLGLIDAIHDKGMKAGVAVKPATPVDTVFDLAAKVDMILIMTVEPGFGGQKFMADMMPKVEALRQRFPDLDIEVDGGLAPSTIDAAANAGANVIVAGTSVFKAKNPDDIISEFRRKVNRVQGVTEND